MNVNMSGAISSTIFMKCECILFPYQSYFMVCLIMVYVKPMYSKTPATAECARGRGLCLVGRASVRRGWG